MAGSLFHIQRFRQANTDTLQRQPWKQTLGLISPSSRSAVLRPRSAQCASYHGSHLEQDIAQMQTLLQLIKQNHAQTSSIGVMQQRQRAASAKHSGDRHASKLSATHQHSRLEDALQEMQTYLARPASYPLHNRRGAAQVQLITKPNKPLEQQDTRHQLVHLTSATDPAVTLSQLRSTVFKHSSAVVQVEEASAPLEDAVDLLLLLIEDFKEQRPDQHVAFQVLTDQVLVFAPVTNQRDNQKACCALQLQVFALPAHMYNAALQQPDLIVRSGTVPESMAVADFVLKQLQHHQSTTLQCSHNGRALHVAFKALLHVRSQVVAQGVGEVLAAPRMAVGKDENGKEYVSLLIDVWRK